MEKTNIKVDAGQCARCLCCQLACSFKYTGKFNPEKARIIIQEPTVGSRQIDFTTGCVKGCFLCTRYCAFGALTHQEYRSH